MCATTALARPMNTSDASRRFSSPSHVGVGALFIGSHRSLAHLAVRGWTSHRRFSRVGNRSRRRHRRRQLARRDRRWQTDPSLPVLATEWNHVRLIDARRGDRDGARLPPAELRGRGRAGGSRDGVQGALAVSPARRHRAAARPRPDGGAVQSSAGERTVSRRLRRGRAQQSSCPRTSRRAISRSRCSTSPCAVAIRIRHPRLGLGLRRCRFRRFART